MKLLKPKALLLAAAAGSFLLSLGAAKADNSFYAPGDLVMYFQQDGGTNTVYVSLGNAATLFRGAAAGADVTSIINMINIDLQLTQAFGDSWADDVNLYAGLAGAYSSNTNLATQVNGDPYRTLYVSQSRAGVGNVGEANSSGYSINSANNMTGAAQQIIAQNNTFDQNYNAQAVVSDTSVSTIDDYNGFDAGQQQTAFGLFGGGVQQQGSDVSFGSFGGVNNAEFALDLYRILATTNPSGTVAGTPKVGSYEGTVVLDSAGNVSFISVPEPSTYALFGIGGVMLLFVIRRRNAAAKMAS